MLFDDEVESLTLFDPLTGHKQDELEFIKIYANSHYVTPRPTLNQAIKSIKEAGDRHSRYLDSLEAQVEERIKTGLDTVRLGPATKPAALATSANCVGDMHKLLMKDGSPTVLLGPARKPMTRRKDATVCSGKVSEGLATVMVGG